MNVLFDNLAQGWHSFIRVWHFDRRELELVAAARATVKYGYRLVTEMGGKMVMEGGGMTLTE